MKCEYTYVVYYSYLCHVHNKLSIMLAINIIIMDKLFYFLFIDELSDKSHCFNNALFAGVSHSDRLSGKSQCMITELIIFSCYIKC